MKKLYRIDFKSGKVIFSLLLILLFSIGCLSAYASMQSKDDVTNEFRLSDLSGDIEEQFTSPEQVHPGEDYSKEVRITNTSDAAFFVRVRIFPEIRSAENVLLPANIGEEAELQLDIQEFPTSGWLLGEDGYYYYMNEIESGEETEILFSTVHLNETLGDPYSGAVMRIDIQSEMITSSGSQYRDAWWSGEAPATGNLQQIDTQLQQIIGE